MDNTEAHIVAENAVELVSVEEAEPIDAGLLVATQLGFDSNLHLVHGRTLKEKKEL